MFNAEKQRSGDLEGENGERKGVIYSADFIKCAGEGKPHFIKYGFDGAGWEMDGGVESGRTGVRICKCLEID